ncbi:hypothetical protein Moror_16061 [Moniliophthora roreri MCA 2997]|uniref:HNH nuclease domain-containing protein n=1 Tax=Moniliophthora roreri (strain MCA 2997) TaxID=1381753 RepID=V2XAJ9_MONRO|nr:hypothetical protein Moror_16061 [Moniliophthora roreri MCA 2997]
MARTSNAEDAVVIPPTVKEYYRPREKKGRIISNDDIGWLDMFRLRVIAAALYGFRCLLTLESGRFNEDLNFCHLVARTTNKKHLRRLEYALGLYPYMMFVDSYLNLILLRSDLHHAFDNGVFLIIPHLDLILSIKAYLERNSERKLTKDREKFYLIFSEHVWEYRIFDVNFDPKRAIQRKTLDKSNFVGGMDRFSDAKEYEDCWPPFDNPKCPLQHLESHAHPLFVVFNAVMLLWNLDDETFSSFYHEHEDIRLLHEIGKLLNIAPPPEFFQTGEGKPNEPPLTEQLDYLLPQEARYTHKARAFGELLEEFEKARTNRLSVLPGQVVAPSAKRRKQDTTISTRTLRPKASTVLIEGTDEIEEIEETVEEAEDIVISPKKPSRPTALGKHTSSATSVEEPSPKRLKLSSSTALQTRSSPSRPCNTFLVRGPPTPSSPPLSSSRRIPETPTKLRQARLAHSDDEDITMNNDTDEECEGVRSRERKAREEIEWGNRSMRKRLERLASSHSPIDLVTGLSSSPRRSSRNSPQSEHIIVSAADGSRPQPLPATPTKRSPLSSRTNPRGSPTSNGIASVNDDSRTRLALQTPTRRSSSSSSYRPNASTTRSPLNPALVSPSRAADARVQKVGVTSPIRRTPCHDHDFRNPFRISSAEGIVRTLSDTSVIGVMCGSGLPNSPESESPRATTRSIRRIASL